MKQLANTGVATVVALGLLVAAATAEAAGRVTGLKISNLTVNNLDVDFDVTLYTTSPEGDNPDGFLGREYTTRSSSNSTQIRTSTWTSSTYCNTTTSTYPCTTIFGGTDTCTRTNYDWCTYSSTYTTLYFYTNVDQYYRTLENPNLPAVDFGDGDTLPATQIPFAGGGAPRVYRGSFSHTYPAIGTYTLKVGRYDRDAVPALPNGGNLVTVSSPDTFSYRSAGYHRRYDTFGHLTSSNQISSNTGRITPAPPATIGVSASTNVQILVPVELQSFEVTDGSPLRQTLPAGMVGLGLLSTVVGMVLYRRER